MNWKLVFVGGICMYIAQFVVSMLAAGVIHNGVLEEVYKATSSFWRPELAQDPPDMGALMPLWMTTGIICALISMQQFFHVYDLL